MLALPLGIGKPNPIANEFYRRAARDPGIDLTIITALSLRKPTARSDLERRLLGPIVERVFGNYVELEYAQAMRADATCRRTFASSSSSWSPARGSVRDTRSRTI